MLIRRVFLLCVLLFYAFISYASLVVDMGNSVKTGTYHTFPGLSVTGNTNDKGYVIRFGFSGTAVAGDVVSLPTLPSGWNESATSTVLERVIYIPSGATAADLQNFLRLVQITVASERAGQEVVVWIGEDSDYTNRSVYYSPDTDHWYEFVPSYISWVEAYNAALDKTFSGLSGYLVTITSETENNFVTSVAGNNFWFAGTRMDIRPVLDVTTGKLNSVPTTSMDYWYWTAGPEWADHGKDPANSVFYDKKVSGASSQPVSVAYPFTNWKAGEPNDWDNVEAYGYSEPGNGGVWNDYNGNNTQAFVVEYNGTMQGVSANGVIVGASVKSASIGGTVNNGTLDVPALLHDGDILTYTITAANLSATSPTVIVRDTVPEGLDIVSGSISDGGVFTASTREIMWTLNVPVGSEQDVSFSVKKIAGATNVMINTAYVISDGTTIKRTNQTYHTGEPKLKYISYQYMACPGADVEVGFYEQEGVSYKWYDAAVGGSLVSSSHSMMETKDGSAMQVWYVEVTYDGEVLPGRMPVYLELAVNCGSVNPVGCANEGTLLFKEDFGGNDLSDPEIGEPLSSDVISYVYMGSGAIHDGGYSIRKVSNTSSAWYEVDDHTYSDDPTRGYMLQVNAAYEPGQFYSLRIDRLLSNTTLYFSTWIMSVLNYNGEHPTNAIFILEDGENNVIAKYYTGDIPDTDPTWKQYGFEFTIPEGQTSLVLKLVNNGVGSSGNDFVMDDIEVRLCVPGAEILKPVAEDTLVCVNQGVELIGSYVDRDNIFGNNLAYRWEWSETGDISNPNDWSVVAGTGISGISGTSDIGTILSTLSIDEMLPEYDRYYRFVVSIPANIDEYYWRAMSRVVHVMMDTCIIANPDYATTIPNTPIEIDMLANDTLKGCSESNVMLAISSQLTAQHGTVSLVNGKLLYSPDSDWFGLDSVRYILTDCSSIYKDSAVVYIYVPEKPDNIIDADCFTNPSATEWSIKEVTDHNTDVKLSNVAPVLVGDLDGDGYPEVVSLQFAPAIPGVSAWQGLRDNGFADSIIIYKGPDLKQVVAIANPDPGNRNYYDYKGFHLFNGGGIALGKPSQGASEAWIYAMHGNRRVYAFDIQGNLKWSNPPVLDKLPDLSPNSTRYNETLVDISVADFNNDGIAELICGPYILNALTGDTICSSPGNKGLSNSFYAGMPYYRKKMAPFAADINGDGRLEYLAGNEIYTVDIAAGTMTLYQTIAPPADMQMIADGKTQVADIDLDGQLDIIISNADVTTGVDSASIWIWSPARNRVIAQKKVKGRHQSLPFIGDIDGDKNPEILFVTSVNGTNPSATDKFVWAFKYEEGQNELTEFWRLYHTDPSGTTGITLFDFNQDGISEIVYRDVDQLRIIDGSLKTQSVPYDIATIPCHSGTAHEYPVVADIDNDGSVEIVVNGHANNYQQSGPLRIFKSAGSPWAPGRKVWNQYSYNAVHVNEDLSIPKYPLSPVAVFPGDDGILGTADDVRPYNAFLQQQTSLNKNGTPLWLAPDVYPEPALTGSTVIGDSVSITVGIINQGDASLASPLYISLYNGSVALPNLIITDSADMQIHPGDTVFVTVGIADITLFMPMHNIVIRVNDKEGTFAYQAECNESNNEMIIFNPALQMEKNASIDGIRHNGTYSNPVSVLFSEEIEYEIVAVNLNRESSGTLIIRDTIPAYLDYVTGSATTGSGITVDSLFDVAIGAVSYDILKWTFSGVASMDTRTVSFKATPQQGVCASQPLFINRAWTVGSDTILVPTNYTYHQGASIGIATFSAGYGGQIYNAEEQALDYRTSPRSGIVIVPDEGYCFTGWSHERYVSLRGQVIEAQSGIVRYDTLTVYGNVNLHANFALEEYPIRYHLNGGINAANNPEAYTIESDEIRLDPPKKTGDTFVGWIGSNGDAPQQTVIIPKGSTNALEFYANYLHSGYEDDLTADENIEDKIWVTKGELYIKTSKIGRVVRIYSMEGILQKSHVITTEGVSKIKLPRGFYVVTLDHGIGQKVMIK